MDQVYSPQFEYQPNEPKSSFKSHLIDFIESIVVIGAIFALVYLFIAQPHKVSGSSMYPTFVSGDYILTDKVSYRFNLPKRGDIVVLKNPRNESQDFIKRIIALPGDNIKVLGGRVYINDLLLDELYLKPEIATEPRTFLHEGEEIKVGLNQYFIFGDNRNASSDSREWGPITKEEIIGKVFFRYFPLQSFGTT